MYFANFPVIPYDSVGDGNFKNGVYPVYAYVDYVRVWKAKPPQK